MRRALAVCFGLATLLSAGPLATIAVAGPPPASGLLFRFADPRIAESSGLATSSYGDGRVYTHNDSGDSARFFAVDSSGATVAVYTLRGATNVDWEDMAAGTDAAGKPVLYFADIGDNDHTRSEIDVYQVAEPRGPSADVPWVRYRFRYPDGPHDAETLLVHPRSHRFFVATKELLRDGELYSAPATLSTTDVNVLAPLRSVPPLTTSGDFSPDGYRVALLTYLRAYWSAADLVAPWEGLDVPTQKQDEAITFTRDGSSVLVGSEGVHSAVYSVALPSGRPLSPATVPSFAVPSAAGSSVPPVAVAPAPSPSASATPAHRRSHTWWWVVVAAVLLVAVALVSRRILGNRAVHVTDPNRHD